MLLNCDVGEDLDCKEIQPVNLKGNQPCIFIGRTDAEAEVPIFGHLMWRTDSVEKTLMLGKTEGRRRRGWQRMRSLDGITDSMDMSLTRLWDSEGQGSLVCCNLMGCKESKMGEQLNNNSISLYVYTTPSLSTHLLMDTEAASRSWWLYSVALRCMYLFELDFSPDICPELGLQDNVGVIV